MRYWYDLEFSVTAPVVELLSIGVVAEDGREYYAVSTEYGAAGVHPWVQRVVVPQLPPPADPAYRSLAQIRDDLEGFFDDEPVWWAWYGGYDHVCLTQLWGDMPSLPRHLPRFTMDVRQLWEHLGRPPLPDQPSGEHQALADARHVQVRWEALAERAYRLGLEV